MEQAVREIVAKVAEIAPDFASTANLRDLGVDSIRALEILFQIEKAFGVNVPEASYGAVRTFEDLMRVVEEVKR